ncbi:MAG: hypothetical protein HY901_27445 [Deltaproteobacteria bacterium]|nr:hypothetical protein [Deltaproteobacteria bacterium]
MIAARIARRATASHPEASPSEGLDSGSSLVSAVAPPSTSSLGWLSSFCASGTSDSATFVARATRRPVIQIAQGFFWPVALGSLFFNLRAELDVWALYFFGSFFLGMAVQWGH